MSKSMVVFLGLSLLFFACSKKAEEKAKKLQLEQAKFECCSIFNYHLESNKYDLISANGFIEYISYEELNKLLEVSLEALKPNGSLV